MKNILSDLHSIINELEDDGLTREASTLQDVFIKVAAEMDDMEDDSSCEDELANLVDKHGFEKVLSCLADLVSDSGDEDDETEEFAYGKPRVSVPGFNPKRLNTPDYGSQRTMEQIRRVQMGLDPDEVGPQPNSFDSDAPEDFRRTKFSPEDVDDDTQDYAFGDESPEVDPMRQAIVEKFHQLNELWNATGGKQGMDHNNATLAARKEWEKFNDNNEPPIGLDEIINNKPYPLGHTQTKYDPTASMIAEDKRRPGYHD